MDVPLIIIFCNANDLYLARICIASIRYFYPDIDIFIVKDILNGNFSLRELEEVFKVKELSLGIKKFGWGAAKVHALLSDKFPGRRVLLLDADIFLRANFLRGCTRKPLATTL